MFSEEIIAKVWEKAFPQPNNNPNIFRKDYSGAWICYSEYGKRTEYGWEIDHLKPLSKGGTDDLSNLYPLFWKNNLSKGEDYPEWHTQWSSSGVKNESFIKYWRV